MGNFPTEVGPEVIFQPTLQNCKPKMASSDYLHSLPVYLLERHGRRGEEGGEAGPNVLVQVPPLLLLLLPLMLIMLLGRHPVVGQKDVVVGQVERGQAEGSAERRERA